MKKTLSIHLGRQLFIIEEDAYDRLQVYIQRLENSFKSEEGSADIIEDIEMRFAELLLTYLGEHRKVVGISDVELAISSLGEPEEISDENHQEEKEKESTKKENSSDHYEYRSHSKRLFRDTSNGALAGICSGLSAYLNIDPVIVRIIFVIFGFMGFGVPLYILLWIVIPNAKSPAERLQMRGKPVNIETLKEEFENATSRIKNDVGNAADKFRNSTGHIATKARGIASIVSKIIGFGIIVFSFIWLIIFTLVITGVIDVFPTTGDQQYASLNEFLRLVIPVNKSFSLVWASILIVGFLSPLFGIMLGTRIVMGSVNRFFKINLIVFPILIVVAIFCGIMGGIQASRDYAVYSEVETQQLTLNVSELKIEELPVFENNQRVVSTGGLDFITIEHKRIIEEGIHIKYRPSADSLFHIYQISSAHGVDRTSALKRGSNVRNQLRVEGNKLLINPYYSYPVSDGMRSQEVEIIIEKPANKKLIIKGYEAIAVDRDRNGMFYANEDFQSWDD